MTRLACIVLAAGGSRRLGIPKQLVRFRSRPLLLHAVQAAAAASGASPFVVVGAEALRLRALLQRNSPACVVIENRAWREGLGTSLRTGLAAVAHRAGAVRRPADAVLIVLADQPLVDAAALRRLVDAWRLRPGRPAAAAYAGRLGVPAVLPRSTWTALRGLEGDIGARRLLAAAPAVTAVALPEAELDIDRPEDLTRLRLRHAHRSHN